MSSLEKSGLEIVAKLMALSARTAPKTGGVDHVRIKIADPGEQNSTADMMRRIGGELLDRHPDKRLGDAIAADWASDARAIRESGLLVLIGIEGRKAIGLNCGGCGFPTCSAMLRHPRISMRERGLPGP